MHVPDYVEAAPSSLADEVLVKYGNAFHDVMEGNWRTSPEGQRRMAEIELALRAVLDAAQVDRPDLVAKLAVAAGVVP